MEIIMRLTLDMDFKTGFKILDEFFSIHPPSWVEAKVKAGDEWIPFITTRINPDGKKVFLTRPNFDPKEFQELSENLKERLKEAKKKAKYMNWLTAIPQGEITEEERRKQQPDK